MIMNIITGNVLELSFRRGARKGVIRRRAISRSNIRNRIATMKNRKENGDRADFIGSNPHS